MSTKLTSRSLPGINGPFIPQTRDNAGRAKTSRIRAVQRDFYVLVGVFLASLTATSLAVAIAAAIMLANATP